MTQSDNPNIAYKYNSQRWKRLRKLKRELDPFCERCKDKGKFVAAKIIHHKEYITADNYEDDSIFFNLDNLESLCLDCHNKEHFGEKCSYCFDINGDIVSKEWYQKKYIMSG